jgi:hypothetical protein
MLLRRKRMSEFFKITPGTSLRDAVREEVKRQPHGMTAACAVIGVSHPQTITNYTCNTKRDTHSMSLDQFEKIIEWSGGGCIAQAVAEMAGGMYLPMQHVDYENIDIMKELVVTVNSLGDLIKEVSEAVKDNKVDSKEWGRIRAAKFELHSGLNRMVGLAAHMRE